MIGPRPRLPIHFVELVAHRRRRCRRIRYSNNSRDSFDCRPGRHRAVRCERRSGNSTCK